MSRKRYSTEQIIPKLRDEFLNREVLDTLVEARVLTNVGGGTTINECTGPVAAMVMHNPKDRLAPFSTGETARDQLLSQNQCSQNTAQAQPTAGNCMAYQNCNSIAPLIWCPHTVDYWGSNYYPHTWPDFAGPEIWKFFEGLPE